MFGSIFDWNRDGKTDVFEAALGLQLLHDLEEQEAAAAAAEGVLYEGLDTLQNQLDELETLRDELQGELDRLQGTQIELELNTPSDVLSRAYTRWERHEELVQELTCEAEEELSQLDDQISELEEQITELEMRLL